MHTEKTVPAKIARLDISSDGEIPTTTTNIIISTITITIIIITITI